MNIAEKISAFYHAILHALFEKSYIFSDIFFTLEPYDIRG